MAKEKNETVVEKRKTFDIYYHRPDGGISHSYSEAWVAEPQGMFCPGCGKRGGVWVKDSSTDVEVGPSYLCLACGAEWTIQGPDFYDGKNSQVEQRLGHLRGEEGT